MTEDSIFVTDVSLHALFQFSKNDYKLARRTGSYGGGDGELNDPKGLCVDYNTDVYVADSENNRISVFSKDLKFLNCLYTQQLEYPLDVKVTPSCIVVLDWSPNCLHFFSRSGDILRSCVTQGGIGMVNGPQFFCLDPLGNILITDYEHGDIKIFSPSGELIHRVGQTGELDYPSGICLSQTGTIFVVCEDVSILQLF